MIDVISKCRRTIEEAEDWDSWIEKIPELQFKTHWRVKILPPFSGAMLRFLVSGRKEGEEVSVYLDCFDNLASVGEPYWEICPNNCEVERFLLNDTETLLKRIEEIIDYD